MSLSERDLEDVLIRMKRQNDEFNAVSELARHYQRIQMTPVVDDDYPEVRYEYDTALETLLRVVKGNEQRGRFFPKIVTLCGSTRFYEAFQKANYELTMSGHIVLSVGFYPHAQLEMHHEDVGCTPEQKESLDELHKRKIDISDEVLVLNVGGYIGESTRSEIHHAQFRGIPIRYLEPLPLPSKTTGLE